MPCARRRPGPAAPGRSVESRGGRAERGPQLTLVLVAACAGSTSPLRRCTRAGSMARARGATRTPSGNCWPDRAAAPRARRSTTSRSGATIPESRGFVPGERANTARGSIRQTRTDISHQRSEANAIDDSMNTAAAASANASASRLTRTIGVTRTAVRSRAACPTDEIRRKMRARCCQDARPEAASSAASRSRHRRRRRRPRARLEASR